MPLHAACRGIPYDALPRRPPPSAKGQRTSSALRLSKMNLAGWPHPHLALTSPEAIERLIIERDNLSRRQGLAILGGVSIAGQQHIIALSHSPSDGCINTILRLAPGDNQAFDAAYLQLRLQTRLMKGIG